MAPSYLTVLNPAPFPDAVRNAFLALIQQIAGAARDCIRAIVNPQLLALIDSASGYLGSKSAQVGELALFLYTGELDQLFDPTTAAKLIVERKNMVASFHNAIQALIDANTHAAEGLLTVYRGGQQLASFGSYLPNPQVFGFERLLKLLLPVFMLLMVRNMPRIFWQWLLISWILWGITVL